MLLLLWRRRVRLCLLRLWGWLLPRENGADRLDSDHTKPYLRLEHCQSDGWMGDQRRSGGLLVLFDQRLHLAHDVPKLICVKVEDLIAHRCGTRERTCMMEQRQPRKDDEKRR